MKTFLISVSEYVENYINQNSHLPGVPSAADVEKKGIDVGSNQAALLKKIEEYSLYIIEQDKTIKKTKRSNNRPVRFKAGNGRVKGLAEK